MTRIDSNRGIKNRDQVVGVACKSNELPGSLSNMYCKKKMLPLVVRIYTFGISTAAISTDFTDDYFKNIARYW